MPDGLTEDSYLKVVRKTMAATRHHIYKTIKENGGVTDDPKVKNEQRKLLTEVMKRKPEF